jgi:citrate lyase subunit beta/citryl-CoA lyase
MIEKSRGLKVDQIFFDLEDATALGAKEMARENLSRTFGSKVRKNTDFLAPLLSIRINSKNSGLIQDDLNMIKNGIGRSIDSVVFPKVSGEADLQWLDDELTAIEISLGLEIGAIAIEAQIESAMGLLNAEEIAAFNRVCSLSFGPIDFMADIGASPLEVSPLNGSSAGDFFVYPMMKILVAARAYGKVALDGPTVEVRDSSKFTQSALRAKALGFDGKWVLHPDQIQLCNEVFTPSQSEFDAAEELLSAYKFHTSPEGAMCGAAMYNGVMIDEASQKMAHGVIVKGRAAGMERSKNY